MELRKPNDPSDNTSPELKHTLRAGRPPKLSPTSSSMEPAPQSPEIFRQKYLPMLGQRRWIAPPFLRQVFHVLRRLQRDPMRAIDTVRPAHPAAHPLKLLPAARALGRDFAKRIPALRELGIETGLHQLPRHISEQRLLCARGYTRDQWRENVLRHPTWRTALSLGQRRRQPALRDQFSELPGQSRDLHQRHGA